MSPAIHVSAARDGQADAIVLSARIPAIQAVRHRADDRFEVLYWLLWRGRWAPTGPYGRTVLAIDDALRFIAYEVPQITSSSCWGDRHGRLAASVPALPQPTKLL